MNLLLVRLLLMLFVVIAFSHSLAAHAYSFPSGKQSKNFKGSVGVVVPTHSMNIARSDHTSTLLPNGQVLIVGGMMREGDILDSAEIFDPATDTFSMTGTLNQERVGHAAILLQDGRVLIVGGFVGRNETASAEIYDSQQGGFEAIGEMTTPRGGFTATLLLDGRVLIAGGTSDGELATAELFDPLTNTFTATGHLIEARAGHTATLLLDGRVLITGGIRDNQVLATAEIFDPITSTFSVAGNMNSQRRTHAAVLLADGEVLVLGGSTEEDWNTRLSSVEIYSPQQDAFTYYPASMRQERFKLASSVTTLSNGQVLIVGGDTSVEVFDFQAGIFQDAVGQVDADRFTSTATLLNDGRVLIAGGYDYEIRATDQAWLYIP